MASLDGGGVVKTPHSYTTGEGLEKCTDSGFEIQPDRKKLHVSILPEFRDLITPLACEEHDALRTSLRDLLIRWRDAIVIGSIDCGAEYVLLDGHNRYAISRELLAEEDPTGLEGAYQILNFPDREAAKLWILENQVSRRNLSDDQRAIIWNDIREQRSKIARAERAAKANEAKKQASSDGVSEKEALAKAFPKTKTDTRQETATEAKLPVRKLRAAQELTKNAPDMAAKVRAGELSLAAAKKHVRKAHPDILNATEHIFRTGKVVQFEKRSADDDLGFEVPDDRGIIALSQIEESLSEAVEAVAKYTKHRHTIEDRDRESELLDEIKSALTVLRIHFPTGLTIADTSTLEGVRES